MYFFLLLLFSPSLSLCFPGSFIHPCICCHFIHFRSTIPPFAKNRTSHRPPEFHLWSSIYPFPDSFVIFFFPSYLWSPFRFMGSDNTMSLTVKKPNDCTSRWRCTHRKCLCKEEKINGPIFFMVFEDVDPIVSSMTEAFSPVLPVLLFPPLDQTLP